MVDLTKLTDTEILALTIYGEARGESIQGQTAVGNVIRNRSVKRKLTYSEICLQPLQFSCWNKSDPNRAILGEFAQKLLLGEKIDNIFFGQILWIAKGIISESLIDNTRGSDHYLTNALYSKHTVKWADKLTMRAIVGNHIFLS